MQACGDPQHEYFIVSGRHIWSEEPLLKHTARVKGNSIWKTEGSDRKERSRERWKAEGQGREGGEPLPAELLRSGSSKGRSGGCEDE